MDFYNQPGFWAFMTASVSSLFGLLKLAFIYIERSQEKGAKLSMSVERFKQDSIMKSVDYLNGVVARIEPLVLQHEEAVQSLNDTTKMVSMIESNLTKMVKDLQGQYEVFQNRITTTTASFQLLVDKVDALDRQFKIKLGTVTVKK